ncbi:UNKNOWN [Stylonychia lemnae]|uniref:Uncharacterized protein n=1 Tax=Stylonychia lemnae TaxID=5949 RepID=A0A077ZQ66_STYLE|nr:UNKNOWN [Stylonychia lemnae]|eukprot:CDW71525.1 UNKNOWN [Stylonychia lemnae]
MSTDDQARASSLSFYRRFKRVNKQFQDHSEDKENDQSSSFYLTNQNCSKSVLIQNSKTQKFSKNAINKTQNQYDSSPESLNRCDTKSDLHGNSFINAQNTLRSPISSNILLPSTKSNIQNQKDLNRNSSKLSQNKYLKQVLQAQQDQNQNKQQQHLLNQQLQLNSNENSSFLQINSGKEMIYPQSHQSSVYQTLNAGNINLNNQQISCRTALPVIGGDNQNSNAIQQEIQSLWSQPNHNQKLDQEKYNIFNDDCNMRRLALMNSSNKKRNSQRKRYNVNQELSPVSSQSGLLINGLGDQLSESQCRELQKLSKIQKASFTQHDKYKNHKPIKHHKNNTQVLTQKRCSIQIEQSISPQDYIKNGAKINSSDEEEDQIIKAGKLHHERSNSGNYKTNSHYTNNNSTQNNGNPNNIQRFIFLGTDSTITPSNINGNSTKNEFKQNLQQESLMDDSCGLNKYKNNANQQMKNQISPIQYQNNQGKILAINNNTVSDHNTLTIEHASPSISHQNQNTQNDQQYFQLTNQQISTIRKKMEAIAKELAETEEIGLDENTLMRLFDMKADKLLSMTQINKQFTFEENLNFPQLNQSQSQSNSNQSYNQHYYSNPYKQGSQNRIRIIEEQSSNNNSFNQRSISRQMTGNQQVDTFLTDQMDNRNQNLMNNVFKREGSNQTISPKSRKSNSAKFNEHFHNFNDEEATQNNGIMGRQKNLSKEFRDTFAVKDINSLSQSAIGINNQTLENLDQSCNNGVRLSVSNLKLNQTSGAGYLNGYGGDSTVIITNHNGCEESKYYTQNQFQDDSIGNHLLKSGSSNNRSRRSVGKSLRGSQLRGRSGLSNENSQKRSNRQSEDKTSIKQRSSSKKKYSTIKSRFMEHYKTQNSQIKKDHSLTIDNRESLNRHNQSSVLVDPFANDHLISLSDQFINNQAQIYVAPYRNIPNVSDGLQQSQKGLIPQLENSQQQQINLQQQNNQFLSGSNNIQVQYHTDNGSIQHSHNNRQLSKTPAFPGQTLNNPKSRQAVKSLKSRSLIAKRKSSTGKQSMQSNKQLTPSVSQLRQQRQNSAQSGLTQKSNNQLKETQMTNQSRFTHHRFDSQSNCSKSAHSKQNRKTQQSAPRCNCLQKLQITKETIKNALKVKYDARLKDMKHQFEAKFKKNEQIWKGRLDCHKQALQKEQLKSQELQYLIQEMSKRISKVEKKNKEFYSVIKKQGLQSNLNNTNSASFGAQQHSFVQKNDQQLQTDDLQEHQKGQRKRKRRGSKLAQRAYKKSSLTTEQNIQARIKDQSLSSLSSSEDDDLNTNQQENMGMLANSIKEDEDKLRRIEKILYKK